MGYRRGFKTEANATALETRAELGLGPLDRLDPRKLADFLDIPVLELSQLAEDAPALDHLLHTEPEVFSAVTVFRGTERTIVHNDGHARTRQNSNIAHELAHGLLLHPPTPALDDRGCRAWNQDIEDEAAWLAGILLITEEATLAIARAIDAGQWTRADAADRFDVSEQMVQFRLNATAAMTRVARARNYRRRPGR
jgi:Zn-dependent peptidase ImmA (M78 family)